MLYGRCEFGKDDYSLNIVNFPHEVLDNYATTDEDISAEVITIKKSKSKAKKKSEDESQSILF